MEALGEFIGLAGALTLSVGLALGLTQLLLEAMFRLLPGAARPPVRIALRPRRAYPQTNVARVPPHAA